VNTFEVATPLEFVVSVSVAAAGVVANVPLAPDAGAVKVTDVPAPTGVPFEYTVACSGAANGWLTCALCGVPLVAAIVTTGPAVFVRLKLAGVAAPEVEAVTE
jgi:hypothetical protein